MDLSDAVWRKAGRSGENGGDCVELAGLPGLPGPAGPSGLPGRSGRRVAVRDSKDPGGPVLLVTGAALRAAIARAASGA